ncbi:hypothetical protein EDF41_3533 [Curtobacterium sp. PhB171]|nr:hypothetical protein EDF41_3533 [Curtobacterium sp. PhB171]ROQ19238.1 hypothetical protein EDF40_3475 [Curtobacterium sp. PhB170]ROS32860.1 hypothetical protein EDF25_3523 [Curtobacterium sp. PhB131]ROS64423.1 hypothetical protein EDF30_3648 [Curtobacterium sp. PhB141]
MPSQSASRPRRSAPARCPSRTAHPPRPAPPRCRFRERAKHPGASRRSPGVSPTRALPTHVRLPSSARLAGRERAECLGPLQRGPGISPARALRTGRDQPGGAAPVRRTATGPPGGHRHRRACVRPAPSAGPLAERAKHLGASRRDPGIPPARAGAEWPERSPSPGSRRAPRRAGEMPASPRRATAAFRPLAVRALDATSREARRPPGGPEPGLQAVTTTATRASGTAAPASGRNTRVPRDTTRAFRPLAGSGHATAHQPRTRAPQRPRTTCARGARGPGIGSCTWQPRMTASSGSTAR